MYTLICIMEVYTSFFSEPKFEATQVNVFKNQVECEAAKFEYNARSPRVFYCKEISHE